MSATNLETTLSPTAGSAGDELDAALEEFLDMRARLFHIAYRVTGDATGAEDVVQEAWVRWQRTDRSAINNPAAFLTTTTTHLAINVIQSARHRHETCSDLPVNEMFEVADGPERQLEQQAVVEEILDMLMAKLSAAELAAYVLRKAFDYAYADLADLLHTSVPNARQLVRRAQTRIDGDRRRTVCTEHHADVVTGFLASARSGDFSDLERRLAPGDQSGCETRQSQRPGRSLPDAA